MSTPVEQPETHRPAVRHKIDFVVPVAALFVSFVSILIAWYSASIEKQMAQQNERMVQASSLPHLNSSVGSMDRTDGTKQVVLRIANGGVGPAEIRSVEMFFDGRPMRNITELLQSCCGISGGELSLVNLTNRMIRPGETVEYLDINDSRGEDKLYSAGVSRFCFFPTNRQSSSSSSRLTCSSRISGL